MFEDNSARDELKCHSKDEADTIAISVYRTDATKSHRALHFAPANQYSTCKQYDPH